MPARVFFAGQAESVVDRLPQPVFVALARRLDQILDYADQPAPGTLGLADDTRIRRFTLQGYLVTYVPPLRPGNHLWVVRITRLKH